ncbi:YchF family ATPase [Patescibacteria group bacterium]|nr:YchF family ATPase [Patescibacteria group bacterium]MBU1256855.1 YchF family ATPase [Patescibacteria group bacterium]MBU1457875.1 YchF family ATPase [Patescibacteria group bacterium]
MSLKVGIVGLANVGKSTLFNALLKKQKALVANYPFATIEPNVGVVPVPDDRLEKLAEVVKTENIVPAMVTFVDIAGLVKGASKGEGLGNKFLAHIREVDLILYLLRDFTDESVARVGSVNPDEDLETLCMELELADLDAKEKINLLSKKPYMVVYNTDEGELSDDRLRVCAKTGEGVDKLIRLAYEKLGLISFLTAGQKEVRAWTVKKGSTAPVAAGVIHTDFEKNFIKAKVTSFDDFVKFGGWKGVSEAGKLRIEGRDYVMKEGDVIEFMVGK